MKKLLLASSGLASIKPFVGTELKKVRLLFIPTAGNLDDDVWWIDKDRAVLRDMGFIVTELDIEHASKQEMVDHLAASDIVYVAGGNTFHLLYALRQSGFDTLLTHYVNNGGLYAGASAGAIVAGVDIAPIASIDEPEKVPGLSSTRGLDFVNIVPIPHYNMAERSNAIDKIKETYGGTYEIVLFTDDQAIVVDGNNWKLVDSPRSSLEFEWFRRNHQEDAGSDDSKLGNTR